MVGTDWKFCCSCSQDSNDPSYSSPCCDNAYSLCLPLLLQFRKGLLCTLAPSGINTVNRLGSLQLIWVRAWCSSLLWQLMGANSTFSLEEGDNEQQKVLTTGSSCSQNKICSLIRLQHLPCTLLSCRIFRPAWDVCPDLSMSLICSSPRAKGLMNTATSLLYLPTLLFPHLCCPSLTIFFNDEGIFSHVLLHWDGILPKSCFRGQGEGQIHNAMSWLYIQPLSNTVMFRILFGKEHSETQSHTGSIGTWKVQPYSGTRRHYQGLTLPQRRGTLVTAETTRWDYFSSFQYPFTELLTCKGCQ